MFAQGRERAALPTAEAGGIRRPRGELLIYDFRRVDVDDTSGRILRMEKVAQK